MIPTTFDSLVAWIRGKNLVGAVDKADVDALLSMLDKIEEALNEADYDDAFGTKGWRHSILGED